ncbi:19663_t:CDS:2 [Entrophospora sp. SA101]|nr:19663_t:CDS:2 [Entrophospora sp. SA101]
MGIGLIFQAVASSLSAYLSSHWEKEVHKVDCGYAPNGKSSNSFNGPEIQKPSKLFINKYKNVCYNDFYAQRKNDHLLPDGRYIKSKKGVNGTGGKPGKGGKNVKYCGVYINEMVIPEIRGYNEFAEGSKVAMQEVSKGTLKIVSQEAAEKITKEGGEVVVKNFLKIGATESGKHVVKVGASTGASLIKGMGIGLIFQAVASSLSAYLSSHWEKEVHKVDCGYAPNGKSSNSFNGPEIQKPSKLFINKYKNVCYNDFYAQRKNDHLLPDVCLDLDFISNRIYDDCNIVFTDPSSTSS